MKFARVASLATPCAMVLALALSTIHCSGDRGQAQHDPERRITELPDPAARDLASAESAGSPDKVIDKQLMIALAQAKNYHHKADVHLSDGNFEAAIESVRQILAVPFPPDAPEAADVKLDARARLAKLLVAQGSTHDALEIVDAGIAAAKRRSFFLANLYTARGEVYEAIANQLDEREDTAAKGEATAARRNAIEAFEQSITINRELQKALMQGVSP